MDRKPLVASKDYGKDETKAEVLLKKHEAVELDIEGFGATITHLNEKAVIMINRRHFDRCVCMCVCMCVCVRKCVFMFLVPFCILLPPLCEHMSHERAVVW